MQNKEDQTRPSIVQELLSRLTRVKLPDLKSHIVFWSIVVFGMAADLWTKKTVFDWLMQRESKDFSVIDRFFYLVIALNNGAAFGIARGKTVLLTAVSIVALIVILAIFLFGGKQRKMVYIALGLFTAGICGNLYDRIFNDGLVRDFIDIVYWPGRHWPAFNMADSMLCVGAGLMFISCFFTEKSCRKPLQQHK